MRGTAARRRQEREQEPPPDPVAAAVAEIARIAAESDAVQRSLRRDERAIAAEVGRMRHLAAECPNAEQFAASAARLAAELAKVTVELISVGAHCAEAREQGEILAPLVGLRAAIYQAGIAEGERRAAERAAERDACPRAPGAHRKRHLRVAGTALATGAVAASLAGGTVIAAHDSASVHAYAASRPVARMHEAPPDSAVLVPSSPSRAYQPRHAKPSAFAATASPVPSPSLPPSVPVPSQPPAPVPSPSPHVNYDGYLDVQTAQVTVGPLQGAQLTFSATGGEVSWSVSAPDGLVLSVSSGILGDGQAMVITVSASPGMAAGSGWILVTDGDGRSVSVPVTWDAVPAV